MKIYLNSMDKINDFVNIVTKFETDIDLESGKYIVDAKSILGILSLNLLRPIEVIVYDKKIEEAIFQSLQAFLA